MMTNERTDQGLAVTTVSEPSLRWMVKSLGLKEVRIEQGEDRQYRLRVALKPRGEVFGILTARRHERAWRSLDRLTRHIKECFGSVSSISLEMYPADRPDQCAAAPHQPTARIG